MKVLLDESVPQKLRLSIEGGHTVVTTWYQVWSGLKNGALLTAAETTGFGGSGVGLPAKLHGPKNGGAGAEYE